LIRYVATAALALLAACSGEDESRTAPSSEPPPAVQVAPVTVRPIAGGVTASGTLAPREEASVGAELSGYRVLRVLAEEGDRVTRGQPLAVLDPALLEEQIRQAEVAAERAASEYARVADLRGQGVIAEETIAQRGFERRATASQLRDLRTRRARLTLRAPVGGLVLSRTLRPGDVTGGGGTEPPFRIARDALFELEAEVPEAEFARIRPGARVPVRLASGEQLTGTVRRLSPRVDPQTNLGRVRVLLPTSPALRAGGFATAQLGDRGRPVPAVPARAIQYAAGGPSVSVVGPNNRVQRVPVQTGERGEGWVELRSGPPPGARVILGGGALVLPGDQVRPVAERPQ
jgi:HlyD family secretion protein